MVEKDLEVIEKIVRANLARLEAPLAHLDTLAKNFRDVGLEQAAKKIELEIGSVRHNAQIMSDALFVKPHRGG